MSLRSIAVSSFLFSFLLIGLFHKKITARESFSFKAEKVANVLLSSNAKKVYINHHSMETNLAYFFDENKKDISISLSFPPHSMDSIEIQQIKNCCDFFITTDSLKQDFTLVKKWGDTYLSKRNKDSM